MENPIKMDDLGVPLFLEIPISWYLILEVRLLDQVQQNFPPRQLCLVSFVSWIAETALLGGQLNWRGTTENTPGHRNIKLCNIELNYQLLNLTATQKHKENHNQIYDNNRS